VTRHGGDAGAHGSSRRLQVHGRGRGSRLDRVQEQLRQELSALMVSGLKDERIRLATVSSVKVSPDLRNARVLVSAIGTDAERDVCVAALRHAEGHLRGELGQRLENLKVVPRLHFELDQSIAYSVRISSVLRELGTNTDEPDGGGTISDTEDDV
jgi:ribosome-binding factor A